MQVFLTITHSTTFSFLVSKTKTCLKNYLTLNTDVFVLLLQVITCISSKLLDPIFNAIISLFICTYIINLSQFLLIHAYFLLAKSTQICHSVLPFFAQLDSFELFLKFFHYKYFEMLTHGDIHPNCTATYTKIN